jgi:hypothetical protein
MVANKHWRDRSDRDYRVGVPAAVVNAQSAHAAGVTEDDDWDF